MSKAISVDFTEKIRRRFLFFRDQTLLFCSKFFFSIILSRNVILFLHISNKPVDTCQSWVYARPRLLFFFLIRNRTRRSTKEFVRQLGSLASQLIRTFPSSTSLPPNNGSRRKNREQKRLLFPRPKVFSTLENRNGRDTKKNERFFAALLLRKDRGQSREFTVC